VALNSAEGVREANSLGTSFKTIHAREPANSPPTAPLSYLRWAPAWNVKKAPLDLALLLRGYEAMLAPDGHHTHQSPPATATTSSIATLVAETSPQSAAGIAALGLLNAWQVYAQLRCLVREGLEADSGAVCERRVFKEAAITDFTHIYAQLGEERLREAENKERDEVWDGQKFVGSLLFDLLVEGPRHEHLARLKTYTVPVNERNRVQLAGILLGSVKEEGGKDSTKESTGIGHFTCE
jgi:hypothetical protein